MNIAVTVVDYVISIGTGFLMVFTGLRLLGLRLPKERLAGAGLFYGLSLGLWTQVNHAMGASMEVHVLVGMVLQILAVLSIARVPLGLAIGTTLIGWLLVFVGGFVILGLAALINLDFGAVASNPWLYLMVGVAENLAPLVTALLLWRRPFVLVDFSKTSPTSGKTLWLLNVFLAQTLGLVLLGFLSAMKHVPIVQAFPVGLPGGVVWTILAGLPILSILVVRQINRLYQAEMNLREAEKMAAVGRLSATLAHEVRNPVVVIKGYLQVMGQLQAQLEELRHPIMVEAINHASQQVHQMEHLLTDFLAYGRPVEEARDLVDLGVLLREVVEGAEQIASTRHVGIDFNRSAPLPRVRASRKRLHQVVTNLMSNAIDSCPPGGCVRVEAAYSPEERGVTLTVADTGVGIPEENLPRIFEPFFTTKDAGTGLGLSVVKKILDDCGGSIDVESEPGKGTEFTVRLPVEVNEMRTRQGQPQGSSHP